ncbi:hypothetical protein PsYK624_036330 [Phanerochaete sordida]|uniref:Uncharacterized protein n=1 Tax=Phanerochaete sordida TaxID=48140 RepID=A0A9P3L9W1_9APHY|nr:hypothetical protein PsYK624_036330 [Phanerochaete sordida]
MSLIHWQIIGTTLGTGVFTTACAAAQIAVKTLWYPAFVPKAVVYASTAVGMTGASTAAAASCVALTGLSALSAAALVMLACHLQQNLRAQGIYHKIVSRLWSSIDNFMSRLAI